jgi:hypothetical protein
VPFSVTQPPSVTLVFCAMVSNACDPPTSVRCIVTRMVVGASPDTRRTDTPTW